MVKRINLNSSRVKQRQRQVGTYGSQTPLSSTAVERGVTRWVDGSRVDIEGVLNLQGTVNIDGWLNVYETLEVDGNLAVTGPSNFVGDIDVTGDLTITGGLKVSNGLEVTGESRMKSETYFEGAVRFQSDFFFIDTLPTTGLPANLYQDPATGRFFRSTA